MKINIQNISPFKENGIEYHADTCIPLVDAVSRNKIKFNALARHTYPGKRLTEDTIGLNSIGYWDANEPQDWGLDWHRNEGILVYCSGACPPSLSRSPGGAPVLGAYGRGAVLQERATWVRARPRVLRRAGPVVSRT